MKTPALVLTGGLGTRLSTAFPGIPKAMAPLLGRPFIEWKIEQLQKLKVSRIYLLVGHKSDLIEKHLNNRFPELDLHFLSDGEKLRGTGGSVYRAMIDLKEDCFVTFGDNLLKIPEIEFHEFCQQCNSSVMSVTTYMGVNDKKNCRIQDQKMVAYSKESDAEMEYVDYGFYFLKYEDVKVISTDSDSAFDLSVIIQEIIRTQRLSAFTTSERYLEIGTKDALEEAECFLRENRNFLEAF